MKKPLIIIGGPTASGKTNLAVKLAHLINAEIISADSMQVYKFMDIGTAKATKEEMDGIKHYLIDELYPDEEFNVSIFKKMAKHYIEEIYQKGKIPIVVGGTGFYIEALVNDNDFDETVTDNSFRDKLLAQAQEYGNDYLYNKLKEVDPISAEIIHKNNVKRVIRALEYYEQTKTPISEHNAKQKLKTSPYDVKYILLNYDRQKLYDRINLRVDIMITQGLVNEVKSLLEKGYSKNLVSMQGIGYKEVISYLEGEVSIDEAVEMIKVTTRHFAKRQFTWFNRQCNGNWIDVDKLSQEQIINNILKNIEVI